MTTVAEIREMVEELPDFNDVVGAALDVIEALEERLTQSGDHILTAQLQAQDWKNRYDAQGRELATLRDERDTWKLEASRTPVARYEVPEQLVVELQDLRQRNKAQAAMIQHIQGVADTYLMPAVRGISVP